MSAEAVEPRRDPRGRRPGRGSRQAARTQRAALPACARARSWSSSPHPRSTARPMRSSSRPSPARSGHPEARRRPRPGRDRADQARRGARARRRRGPRQARQAMPLTGARASFGGAMGASLRFQKYEGLGNDFILVEAADDGRPVTPERAVALCDRRFGVGADGVLLLLPPARCPGATRACASSTPTARSPRCAATASAASRSTWPRARGTARRRSCASRPTRASARAPSRRSGRVTVDMGVVRVLGERAVDDRRKAVVAGPGRRGEPPRGPLRHLRARRTSSTSARASRPTPPSRAARTSSSRASSGDGIDLVVWERGVGHHDGLRHGRLRDGGRRLRQGARPARQTRHGAPARRPPRDHRRRRRPRDHARPRAPRLLRRRSPESSPAAPLAFDDRPDRLAEDDALDVAARRHLEDADAACCCRGRA